MIKIEQIEICGFRGFNKKELFEFSEGLTVITGRNGTGKSTVLDAIEFALNGSIRVFSPRQGFIENRKRHIWWEGDSSDSDRYVKIRFEKNDGSKLEICRNDKNEVQPDKEEIAKFFQISGNASDWFQSAMQNSLIRGETATSLSLKITDRVRFDFIRSFFGNATYPDLLQRFSEVMEKLKQNLHSQTERLGKLKSQKEEKLAETADYRNFLLKANGGEFTDVSSNSKNNTDNSNLFATASGISKGIRELMELYVSLADKTRSIDLSDMDVNIFHDDVSEVKSKFERKIGNAGTDLAGDEAPITVLSEIVDICDGIEKQDRNICDLIKSNDMMLPNVNGVKFSNFLIYFDALSNLAVKQKDFFRDMFQKPIKERETELQSKTENLSSEIEKLSAEVIDTEGLIDSSEKLMSTYYSITNELISEKINSLIPILQELFNRLKPHQNWTRIEMDFSEGIRNSINLTVGEGKDPNFLFSSGQRKIASMAFLLSIYLSRPGASWKTLMLDDPFDQVDHSKSFNLAEVIHNILKDGHQLILAVENPSLAKFASRRLRGTSEQSGIFYELAVDENGSTGIGKKTILKPFEQSVLIED